MTKTEAYKVILHMYIYNNMHMAAEMSIKKIYDVKMLSIIIESKQIRCSM